MHEIEIYRPVRTEYGSPWRLALVALLTVAAGWMLSLRHDWWWDILAAVFCMLWFGWSAVQRAHTVILERSFVRVEPEGLTLGNPLRTRFYAWSDVECFTYIGIPDSFKTGIEGQVRVGLYLKSGHPEDTDRHPDKVDVLLPADLEDVDPKDLTRRLNERRLAALGETLAV
jgi:hypothetical protein